MVSNGGPEAGLGASITTESYNRQLEVVSNPLRPASLTPSKLQLRRERFFTGCYVYVCTCKSMHGLGSLPRL